MAKTHTNPLITKLLSEMEARNVKVPQFATEANIPKDRIYKWLQEGNNPKEDDITKIRSWLGLEEVPHGTKELYERLIKSEENRRLQAQGLADELKADKAELYSIIKGNQETIKRNQEIMDGALKTMSASLTQGQQELKEQILHSSKFLADLILENKGSISNQGQPNPSLQKDTGLPGKVRRNGKKGKVR